MGCLGGRVFFCSAGRVQVRCWGLFVLSGLLFVVGGVWVRWVVGFGLCRCSSG